MSIRRVVASRATCPRREPGGITRAASRVSRLPRPAAEQRIRAVHQASAALIAVLITQRRHGLPEHEEQAVYVPLDEIHAPRSMARQARLIKLARDQEDAFLSFPLYRMAAEIAPLPASAALDAICAAGIRGRGDLGIRWYRHVTRDLPAAEVDALAEKLVAHACLSRTRHALR